MPKFVSPREALSGLSPQQRLKLGRLFSLAVALPSQRHDSYDYIACFYPREDEDITFVGSEVWQQLGLDAESFDPFVEIYVRDWHTSQTQLPLRIERSKIRLAPKLPPDYINIATAALRTRLDFVVHLRGSEESLTLNRRIDSGVHCEPTTT